MVVIISPIPTFIFKKKRKKKISAYFCQKTPNDFLETYFLNFVQSKSQNQDLQPIRFYSSFHLKYTSHLPKNNFLRSFSQKFEIRIRLFIIKWASSKHISIPSLRVWVMSCQKMWFLRDLFEALSSLKQFSYINIKSEKQLQWNHFQFLMSQFFSKKLIWVQKIVNISCHTMKFHNRLCANIWLFTYKLQASTLNWSWNRP